MTGPSLRSLPQVAVLEAQGPPLNFAIVEVP